MYPAARRLVFLSAAIAALAAVLALVLPAATAPAAAVAAAGNRVGASPAEMSLPVGLSHTVSPVQHRCGPAPQAPIVSGACVAAEDAAKQEAVTRTVGEVLSDLRAGRNAPNLEIDTEAQLNQVFDELSQDGTEIQSTYPGKFVELPDGTQVGLCGSSRSGGATIDIFNPDGTHIKVHLP